MRATEKDATIMTVLKTSADVRNEYSQVEDPQTDRGNVAEVKNTEQARCLNHIVKTKSDEKVMKFDLSEREKSTFLVKSK